MEIGDVLTWNGTVFSQPSTIGANLATASEIPLHIRKTCHNNAQFLIIIKGDGAESFLDHHFFSWVSLFRSL
ncbi:hypothetical protein L3Y34_019730 [Caenorhabditis briggsae]|uniref:Uncharacterized protein n=1 Tax=Caenorhabditis briggsae TaxID=6238 RepID=A0AAE9IX48_CAEBR|nr:hypothetical protein L3Y34_019730 [Caenorhabditis briggsae]